MPSENLLFKPTNQIFDSLKELKQAQDEFYNGELDETYAKYCACEAMHAFWINYCQKETKCNKQDFSKRLHMLTNQLLSDL